MKTLVSILFCCIYFVSNAQLYPVDVYAATSLQNPQGGQDINKALDGDINTIYHNQWYTNGIPDEVIAYFMPQGQSIKEMVYIPRQESLNGIWSSLDVAYATHADPNTYIAIATNLSWTVDYTTKTIVLPTAISNVASIKFSIHAAEANYSSCAELQFFSENPPSAPEAPCMVSATGLQIAGANDVQIPVVASGSFASSFQSGENIEKSFDGDLNTLYHSSYGNTVFPVTLNYHFDGATAIDYLKYIPRTSGSNGDFGSVSIAYNTTGNATFVPLMNFNFSEMGIPTNVVFPSSITPLNIQIVVNNGNGGWASCAEMQFFAYGAGASNPTPPAGIFADDLFSQLNPSVTQSQIDAISSPFYKNLAQCIFNGTYNLQYRTQAYEVYRPIQEVSQELKVGTYDPYENATGIAFAKGDTIVVFAKNSGQQGVFLLVKDFEEGYWSAENYYPLTDGINIIAAADSGLAYVHYFNTDLNLPDVELNIVTGKVNGYFDLTTSSPSEWPAILMNDSYSRVDIRGEFTHLVYHKNELLNNCPIDVVDLIKKYDTIVRYERQLMGLFKYNRSPKNRMLSVSDIDGGWFAGGSGIHLDLTWGPSSVTDPKRLDLWGIPHEFGHINQLRPSLNWVGTTEVTNNVYSVWVNYKMNYEGRKYTRLEESTEVPTVGMPAVKGGTINGQINSTHVLGNPLQKSAGYDVFKVLVPFWQLELYYQQAGACKNAPELSFNYPSNYTGVDYAHWYGTVCELSRNMNTNGLTNGDLVLNFVKNTCDAVQEDLTTFFTNSGFLKPINDSIDDYGLGYLVITQEMIDETIAYIQSQGYAQPVSPVINYLSAHSVDAFRNLQPLTGQTGVGVSLNNTNLLIQNNQWQNAVAFETYDDNGDLMHVSIVGTNDVALNTTSVFYPDSALAVYAVGYDGQKILVYPADLGIESQLKNQVKIAPNPFANTLSIASEVEINSILITDLNGNVVEEKAVNATNYQMDTRNLKSGMYVVKILSKQGIVVKKVVKY